MVKQSRKQFQTCFQVASKGKIKKKIGLTAMRVGPQRGLCASDKPDVALWRRRAQRAAARGAKNTLHMTILGALGARLSRVPSVQPNLCLLPVHLTTPNAKKIVIFNPKSSIPHLTRLATF